MCLKYLLFCGFRRSVSLAVAGYALFFGVAISADVASSPVRADEPERLHVLFLGSGGIHVPVQRLRDLAPPMLDRNISLYYTEDLNDLSDEVLRYYDAVFLYGNIDAFESEEQAQALFDYVENGGGFVPIHSACGCFLGGDPELRDAYIRLVGAQFLSHGAGVMTTEVAEPDHEIMRGYEPFESWDETYIHQNHNEEGRTVLTHRRRSNGELEPWTWVREQGQGRVFYTAWGHDHRTWQHPGFHDLLERGIRWAAGQDVQTVLENRTLHQPFETIGKDMTYPPPQRARDQGIEDWQEMQLPISPEDSMRRMVVPGGFRVELFAAEPDVYNPMDMNWDERGRLWVIVTEDYPNDLMPEVGVGNDQIRILEDTTGDGRADKVTIFADGLNIPTSFVFANGGVIVHQAPQTLFLRDTTGDDQADEWTVLFDGWRQSDTHAGPNNLFYGFDNWIWGAQGYDGFRGEIGGEQFAFRQGAHRFNPDASRFEFLRSTNNNTWGLGFGEDGSTFISTANGNPTTFLPFANRYYELTSQLSPTNTERLIEDQRMIIVTDMFRQIDFIGGYTSAAGQELYTARTYPERYWNRIGFVSDPTGYAASQFIYEPDGTTYRTTNPNNLVASDDQWFAPVTTKVGPDGHVWVADWYNHVIAHNVVGAGVPSVPHGPGNAYPSELRDVEHGRIYRIVWEEAEPYEPFTLHNAGPEKLVETLGHHNLRWRLHAQRLLVERGETDVLPALIERVQDRSVDEIGLNPGAVHALWTMHGLGLLEASHHMHSHGHDNGSGEALAAVREALSHPCWAVRRNAIQVLPENSATRDLLLRAGVLNDDSFKVRKDALLALAVMPPADEIGRAVFVSLRDEESAAQDPWLRQAAVIAGSQHAAGFLAAARSAGFGEDDEEEEEYGNLLRNPTFENIRNGSPVGWRTNTYGGSARFELREGEGRDGGNALGIHSANGADASWLTDVRLQAGQRYRLGGWVRTRDLDNRGGRGAQFNIHGGPMVESRTPAVGDDGNDWRYLEVEYTQPNNGTFQFSAVLGGWGQSAGTMWISDPFLYHLGAATAGLPEVFAMVRAHATDAGVDLTEADVLEIPDDAITVEIGVVEGILRFDLEEFRVEAGQTVHLIFRNTDHMEHNILFIQPGTLAEVGRLADEMATQTGARAREYVPDTPHVWEASPILDPDEVYEMVFTAPGEPGEYPYVCTIPGHWRIMQGIMHVE